MGRDEAGSLIHFDPIFRLAEFELAADQRIRHRVAVAVHIDVALDVDEPMMEGVHLGHEERQRREVGPFDGEELPRTRMEVPLGMNLIVKSATGLRADLRARDRAGASPAARRAACHAAVARGTGARRRRPARVGRRRARGQILTFWVTCRGASAKRRTGSTQTSGF
jgi:hypothetical protein